jgi:thioredoxin reductase (NADPH)
MRFPILSTENTVSKVRDILILGSGAAGYTAGIYAARANRHPLILGGLQVGGQLTITTDVENYPGFAKGIQGPELMEAMKAQAIHQGAEVVEFAGAERVDFSRRPFRVWTDEGTEYEARAVIVATGASAKLLGIESENRLMGYGVSACATCDGTLFKGKRTVVVGGGDTAIEEATYLSRLLSEVVVVHRRDELRASKAMQERAFRDPKLRFVWDHEVVEILGDDKPTVTGVKIKNVKTGETTIHPTDSVFVAIGHKPNTDFLAGQLPMDSRGYLKVEAGSTKTKVPGVFAAGDVADPFYRQAVTAAGSGCMAAIDAEHFLAAEDHKKERREAATASGAGR